MLLMNRKTIFMIKSLLKKHVVSVSFFFFFFDHHFSSGKELNKARIELSSEEKNDKKLS
jgi:hypothetical protein